MPASPVLTIDQFLARIEKVRTSAGVAQRVLRLIENQDFNVQQVVGILETDPALATQILRLVNSSYFGLPRRVANLQQAVCLLGAHTLRLSLLNYGVLQCLAKTLPSPRRDEFLRHSLTVATVAEKLVRQQGDGSPEEAYCTGLIADVGVLAFAQIDPARYEDIFLNNALRNELLGAEQACFGFDHATLGARLLRHWHLPEAMAAAVAVHHELPQGPMTEATPLQVAG
ncbi:MAG TPA: HDOD domain-containing protein, partial [Pirellulaceae bacterium]|nr:HDOD domain-containing protein [Pirellulaceae bacterium]